MGNDKFRNPKPLGLAICTLAVVYGITVLASIGILAHLHGLLHELLAQPPESLTRMQGSETMGSMRAWFDLKRELTHATAWVDLDESLSLFRRLLLVTNSGLFLIWISMTVANLSSSGNNSIFSPGWTVAWFLVPVAQWVMPHLAVQDLWETSHDYIKPGEHEGNTTGTSGWGFLPESRWPVLPWWMLSILAFLIFATAPQFIHFNQHTLVTAALTLNAFELAGLAVLLIAIVLFVHIVWRISSLHAGHQRAAQRLDARQDTRRRIRASNACQSNSARGKNR